MSGVIDMVVRGGQAVTPGGLVAGDIAVAAGKIVGMGGTLAAAAGAEVVDASGCLVFPGFIDPHVHFNEPGRTDWEGVSSGSQALAAGGGTTFFDMPLNSLPPTLDRAALEEKRKLCEEKAVADFALWGGLTPANLDRLEELADGGAIGFKAFLSATGTAEFQHAGPEHLRRGMKVAAARRLPVAVHAESEAMTSRLAAERRAGGRTAMRDYLESRPVAAELEAVRVALDLAGETGCRLYIVHVSSPEAVELIAGARRAGVEVAAETCPHYLLLDEDDAVRIGAAAKCAPPLRDARRRRAMWEALHKGNVATVASDHSPAPLEMKAGSDFFALWGGIAGCQHGAALFLGAALVLEGIAPEQAASLLSGAAAAWFGLAGRKGVLRTGADADLAFVAVDRRGEPQLSRVEEAGLLYRHPATPYLGQPVRARIVRTIRRGETVWDGNRIRRPRTRAAMLKPERP